MKNFHAAHHVAVLTAPRPTPTLADSLHSVEAAGWGNPLICFDRDRRGCYWNFRIAMSTLVPMAKHGDSILIFEDDVQVAANLRSYLKRRPPPADCVVSLYTAAPNHCTSRDASCPGWHRITKLPKLAMGALATLWPMDIARRFIAEPPHPEWADRTDHAIGLFCRDNEIPLVVHTPSFVRHNPLAVGHENSALGDGPNGRAGGVVEARQCAAWCEDADDLLDFSSS